MAFDQHNSDEQSRDSAIALTALADPGAPLTSPCPSTEQIAAWHDEALPDNEALMVKEHVARCDQCFDLWSGMLDALKAPATVTEIARPQPPAWRRPLLALAATLFGIALLLPLLIERAPATLPAYQVRVNQSATLRGDEPAPAARVITLAPGDRFQMLFLPTIDVSGDVQAAAFVQRDGRWEPLEAPPVIDQSLGVLEINGTVGTTVRFPHARNDLMVAVGRAGHLPDSATLERELGANYSNTTPGWTAWRFTVVITPSEE